MKPYGQFVARTESLALVGLGHVGMPIARSFGNNGLRAIGFGLDKARLDPHHAWPCAIRWRVPPWH